MPLKLYAAIILSCVATAFLLTSIYFVFRPDRETDDNAVRVHKGWGSFVLFAGCFLAFGGVWSLFYGTNGHPPNSLLEGVSVSCMGFAFIGLMLPSFTHWHDVYWNEDYLVGPNKLFGPTLQFSRTIIYWSDIVEFGQTFTMYKFVKSASGEKIYFSPYSVGLDEIEGKIWESL